MIKTLILKEKNHNFIEFNNEINARIKVRPMYFELGFSPVKFIYGRYILLDLLLKTLEFLPREYGILMWDVYRPREVQSRLFDWMKKEIQKKYPDMNEQWIYEETKKYMSVPSKIGDEYCPPHLSGGAIDLTLYNISDGKELEMGTQFDDSSEKAHRDYYNLKTNLSSEDEAIKKRRQDLQMSMENSGFTSYQFEWWHFDFGNLFWSQTVNQPALFGPLFGNEEWPKKDF